MNKKWIVIITCMLLVLGTVRCCAASEPDITGDWYCTLVRAEGEEYRPNAMGVGMTITLNDDGSAQIITERGDDSETMEGTWSEAEEGWTLDCDGIFSVTLEDDTLTLIQEEVGMEMEFEREKPEMEEESPVRTDAVLEDFNGIWHSEFYVPSDGTKVPMSRMGIKITITIEDGMMIYHVDYLRDFSGREFEEPRSGEYVQEVLFTDGILKVGNDYAVDLKLHEDGTMTEHDYLKSHYIFVREE